ncbi:hypothetical protein NVV93_07260 [Pseudomonas sp. LS44]|uniref:hypothetical protein n=1 Tax=Pseudomonas sp. LS44 TaxID=1357074 RepID=UPI00215A5364|nr:hypothetical protein [Pseudomonas sp. LS44]UVE19165.1 hypothetical protein NVV93_07260 [Pseudomonas sp. LS44]
MARKRPKANGRKESGSFAALPHIVMDHDDYKSLSGSAMKVLMCVLRQYKGGNNGDLSASFTQAKPWGIGSKSTLTKALNELQERDLITCTRQGRFIKPGGCCALYAVTWQPIDECGGKLEVSSTITPPRKFSLERAKNPVQKLYPLRTETVPMTV